MPVQGIDAAELVDTWGAPRGRGRQHEGIDVFARCGRPVLSTTEGLVLSSGHSLRGGRTMWVLGPGGLRHYYAHLRAFGPPRPGARVRAGDTLAYVGNSGSAKGTPCHLHYGIYGLRGPARNPYPLLTADRDHASGV